jgi:hypothetical protein
MSVPPMRSIMSREHFSLCVSCWRKVMRRAGFSITMNPRQNVTDGTSIWKAMARTFVRKGS